MARSSGSPMPKRSTTPGRKFWMNTSAVATSFFSVLRPASLFTSIATDRLLRLLLRKLARSPFCEFPAWRV